MQANYKDWFWEEFDKNFQLNYRTVLAGLTTELFESSHIVNHFYVKEKAVGAFYVKIARLLLEQEGLEDDLTMPISDTEIDYRVHSLNLKAYLLKMPEIPIYDSIDDVYPSRYIQEKKHSLNDDFSYLLGNYVRFYKDNGFRTVDKKRLYTLTAILEKFCCRGDSVTLKITNSIDGSSIKLANEILLEKLAAQARKFS